MRTTWPAICASAATTLLGLASGPAHLADGSRGQPPAPTATRRNDKLATVKAAPVDPAPEQETKGLALSKAFDSHEATMKLAALTGAEREIPASQRRPQPADAAAAAAPRRCRPPRSTPGETRSGRLAVTPAAAPRRRTFLCLCLGGRCACCVAIAATLVIVSLMTQ